MGYPTPELTRGKIQQIIKIDVSQISKLSKFNQRTVKRLSKDKKVSPDRVTGLINTIKNDFYSANPDALGDDWSYGTTTINGSVPPGRLLPLKNVERVVDEIVGDQHVSVNIGTRKAGTRVGIHVNEYGGTTFVIGGKGRYNEFLEGFPNSKNPVGSYFYVPSNTPVSAANLSRKDIRIMDIFVTPVGVADTVFIEPGYPGYNPPV